MSNNIYDILKKINKLENNVQTLKESKSMDKKKEDKKDESKKKDKADKGAIAEAVAKVEQQLNEKYMGFKKLEKSIAAKGDVRDPGAVAASIGRKKYGKEKFQKAAAAGKKLGEGEVEESGLQAYLGKKKYGETGMKALQQAGREGASKEKMAKIRAKHDKMDEGEYTEDQLTPKQQKFAKLAPPPDKITYADKIAGAKKGMKKEGNAFSGAVAKAKAAGADEFKVGGKEYKVQEGFPTVSDAEKRMREKEGKTSHGKKTTTGTGVKHERDYDAVEKGADVDTRPKGRGRPKKDRFA